MGSNGSHDSPSGHQAKADRALQFLITSDNRSSVVNLSRPIALAPVGQGADDGRMARVAEAWDRSTAPGRDVAEYDL